MSDEAVRKFRSDFERVEDGPLGINTPAIERLLEVLKVHEECENETIRNITGNIGCLGDLTDNFMIFSSSGDTYFLRTFNALQINPETGDLIVSHEFAHALVNVTKDNLVPNDFLEIFTRAKANTLSPETKKTFINYIKYLSDKENDERTPGEVGPVSDIISSILLHPAVTLASTQQKYVLPSYHDRPFYFNEEKGEINLKNVFDEQFANFYALLSNNCTKELETLRLLLGEEWFCAMENEVTKIAAKLNSLAVQKDKTTPQIAG